MNNNENQRYLIRPCTSQDLDAVCRLEDETLQSLSRPELLRHNGRQRLEPCLQPPHLTVGAFCDGRLAAFAILFDPEGDRGEDLSHCVGLGHLRSLNYKLCIVAPLHRGHRLQVRLGQWLESEARRRGAELLCSTVSPMNEASMRSLQRLGYRQGPCVQKYGYRRWVYYKRLSD